MSCSSPDGMAVTGHLAACVGLTVEVEEPRERLDAIAEDAPPTQSRPRGTRSRRPCCATRHGCARTNPRLRRRPAAQRVRWAMWRVEVPAELGANR